jgi:hypothetical protein
MSDSNWDLLKSALLNGTKAPTSLFGQLDKHFDEFIELWSANTTEYKLSFLYEIM